MEWGIFLITAQPPGHEAGEIIQSSIEYAVRAEALGFDHAWVLEHHFTKYGLVGSPLMQAAFLLGRTSKLKIGTAIQVIALDHPVRLAEQVALIDQLSGGRLMFGFGRGIFTKDFKVFGCDMSRSRELVDESLRLMRTAWTTGRCKSEAGRFKFGEVEINPPTHTRPHPPLYTVAQSPESIVWAGKHGIPMILAYGYSNEQTLAVLEEYDAAAEAAGHDPTTIPHVLSCIAGASADGRSIREASREHLGWWVSEGYRAADLGDQLGYEFFHRQTKQAILRGERDGHDRVDRYFSVSPIGTPQQCIDNLSRAVELTGITRFALGFEAAGTRERTLDSMQMFAEEVMPVVDRLAPTDLGTADAAESDSGATPKQVALP